MSILEKFQRMSQLCNEIADLRKEIEATKSFYNDMLGADSLILGRLLAFMRKRFHDVKDLHRSFDPQHWKAFEEFEFLPELHGLVNKLYNLMQEHLKIVEQEYDDACGAKRIYELEKSIEAKHKELDELSHQFTEECMGGLSDIGWYIKHGGLAPDKETLARIVGEAFGIKDDEGKRDIAEWLFIQYHLGSVSNKMVIEETDARETGFNSDFLDASYHDVHFSDLTQKPQVKHSSIMLEATCKASIVTELSLRYSVIYNIGKSYEVSDFTAFVSTEREVSFTAECDIEGTVGNVVADMYNKDTIVGTVIVVLPDDISLKEISDLFERIADDFNDNLLIDICRRVVDSNEETILNAAEDFLKQEADIVINVS